MKQVRNKEVAQYKSKGGGAGIIILLIYNLEMKCLVVFAIVALVAARPNGGDRPKPKGPAIFVRPVHRAAQNESYEFKFGIAGMKELNETEVSLWKVVKGEEGPELAETDFSVELKSLTEEEIKEIMEEKKEQMKDIMERFQDKKEDIQEWIEEKKEAIRERIGEEKYEALKEWIEEKKDAIKDWVEDKKGDRKGDDDDRRPKPHPQFKHAIVGRVTVSEVSCEDQGPYLVRYGSGSDDKEEREENEGQDGESKRRPRKPRGAFLILVKGCLRHEPRED